jgi:lysyl-tRNA synthetase class 2
MPSTVIRSYSYDARRRELDIVFQTRRRYRYRHVPLATYAAMNAASSKGAFFNRHIRGRFEFSRDPPRDSDGNRGAAVR